MKHGMFYILGIIVLTIVSVTNITAQVQLQKQVGAAPTVAPSAPAPYYALPSWDQKLPTPSRFIILSDWNNAAVLDKETGLVWERFPSTSPKNWIYAFAGCNALTVGDRMGWRLPTLSELASLLDMSAIGQLRLPSGHPFNNVQYSNYWTADTGFGITGQSGQALVLHLGSGGVVFQNEVLAYFAWCVRGPK